MSSPQPGGYWELVECARLLKTTPRSLLADIDMKHERQTVWFLLMRWKWSAKQIATACDTSTRLVEFVLRDRDIRKRVRPMVDMLDLALSGPEDEGRRNP